jgi:hypothetical protein
VRVFLNDGSARWAEATATGLPGLSQKIETIAIGDVDGDCALDIAVAAYSCGLRVYRRSDAPPCALLADAGPAPCARTCGDDVTLDASASRTCACAPAEARYRWWRDGVLLRDWDPSPVAVDSPAAGALYRVDVACASDLACFASDTVRVVAGGAAAPSIVPPGAVICEGETVTLTVAGAWAMVTWTTDPPGQPGDGAAGASVDASPTATTTYAAAVVDADGCAGLAEAIVEVRPDPLPPPVDASLRVAVEVPDGLRFAWTDLPGTWGGYEILALPASLGPPWPDVLDGPVPAVLATAAPGAERAVDDDGLRDGSPLTFLKVRATSPCLLRPGTTCNGFPQQVPPCP